VRDDSVYLEFIIEGVQLVEQYLGGNQPLEEHLFRSDPLRRDAALRRLETLSDAASHLSAELKSRHPEVHWPQITGFRNVLAHAYMDVDYDLVWRTIVEDLPVLKTIAEEELRQLGSD